MVVTATSASTAYADALKRLSELSPGASGAPEKGADLAGQVRFSDMVQDVLQQSKEVGLKSEAETVQAASNQADIVNVVTAVANAEVTLQTVVAVRDRVIDAYREIIRMPM